MGALNFFRSLASAFIVAVLGAILLAGLGVAPERGGRAHVGDRVGRASAGPTASPGVPLGVPGGLRVPGAEPGVPAADGGAAAARQRACRPIRRSRRRPPRNRRNRRCAGLAGPKRTRLLVGAYFVHINCVVGRCSATTHRTVPGTKRIVSDSRGACSSAYRQRRRRADWPPRPEYSNAITKERAMQNGPRTNMNPRQPNRAKRWESNGPRDRPRNFQSAQRSYERYMALAQAEVLAGDIVGAENTISTPSTISGRCRRTRTRQRKVERCLKFFNHKILDCQCEFLMRRQRPLTAVRAH